MGFTMVFYNGKEVKIPNPIIKAYFPFIARNYAKGFKDGEEVRFYETRSLSAEHLEKIVLPFLEKLQSNEIAPLDDVEFAFQQTVDKEKIPEWVDDYFGKLEWMDVFETEGGANAEDIRDYGAYARYYYQTHRPKPIPGYVSPLFSSPKSST